jgi:polyisoprenoid-binding protein YceI
MTDATATTWTIDPAHTVAGFSVKHMMFTTVRGRFRDVKGTIEVDQQNPARSTVHVEIAAASIDTGVGDRDNHLRSADFFDVAKHPVLAFHSKRIEGVFAQDGDRFTIVGDLTIRGTTKEVTLDAVYEGGGKDPWGGTRAGARATTRIDRRQWGLTWNQALETGGILVANDIAIEIEVQAVKA